MVRRHRILLLDCTPSYEPSEGRFLSHFFRILQTRMPRRASFIYRRVSSKADFLQELTRNRRDILHISAHGRRGRVGTYIILPHGRVLPQDIRGSTVSSKIVFLNACLTSYQDMADAFLDAGAEFFLAPKTAVYWTDAAIFPIIFYERLIIKGTSFQSAFNYAKRHARLGRHYQEYWYSPEA